MATSVAIRQRRQRRQQRQHPSNLCSSDRHRSFVLLAAMLPSILNTIILIERRHDGRDAGLAFTPFVAGMTLTSTKRQLQKTPVHLSSNTKRRGKSPSTTTSFQLTECHSPWQVLDRIKKVDSSVSMTPSMASMCLNRMAKQCIALDNLDQTTNIEVRDGDHDDDENWRLQMIQPSRVSAWEQISLSLVEGLERVHIPEPKTSGSTLILEAEVEALKAVAILSRLLLDGRLARRPSSQTSLESAYRVMSSFVLEPLLREWDSLEQSSTIDRLKPHQLTGLQWAYDSIQFVMNSQEGYKAVTIQTPTWLTERYEAADIPFRIHPGFLGETMDDNIQSRSCSLAVDHLLSQIPFQSDQVKTATSEVVVERRQTAWQGDTSNEGAGDDVDAATKHENIPSPPFAYSGKVMPTVPWSPVVRKVRNVLWEQTGQYYNGCLCNHYPNGESGMRYHIDPDQGTLWDYNTAVVSIGATRKFCFRSVLETNSVSNDARLPSSSELQPNEEQQMKGKRKCGKKRSSKSKERQHPQNESSVHTFVVMDGDMTEMFGDCQFRYQHCIKKADRYCVPPASESTRPKRDDQTVLASSTSTNTHESYNMNKRNSRTRPLTTIEEAPRISLVFKRSLIEAGREEGSVGPS